MAPDADPLRVLLVDDELDLLDCLSTVLRRRNMGVTTCPDGLRALDALAAGSYDVVVLDVKMPGIDGLETLRRMRQASCQVPVILLSGHPSDEAAEQGLADGAFECVMKPVDVALLVGSIRRAAASRSGAVSVGEP